MPVVPYPQNSFPPSPEAAATEAMDGANELLRLKNLLSHPVVGYGSLTGSVAAGGIPDFSLTDHYLSAFDDGWKDISSKMSAASRAMFDLSAANIRKAFASGLAQHEADQRRALRSQALNETLAKATGALIAGTGDEDAAYANEAKAALHADGLAKGLSGQALHTSTARDFGQRVVIPVVMTRLGESKVADARSFFEAHRDGMAAIDAATLADKLREAEAPGRLHDASFAVVAQTVGLDPAPDALDVEAQAKLGILRAHVDAAVRAAQAGGKRLPLEDRVQVGLDAAAKAVKAHAVFHKAQAVLDVKSEAMKTSKRNPRPEKPPAPLDFPFSRLAPEKYRYPEVWPVFHQRSTISPLDLHRASLADTVKSLIGVPVRPGGYKRTIDGRIYVEVSTPTGNRFVRDADDLNLEIQQQKNFGKLDQLRASTFGAGAYGGAYLAGADEAGQDRALELGSATGQILDSVGSTATLSRNLRLSSFRSLPDDHIEAWFGNATSKNYRKSFLTAHPDLDGKVVVHHAVEQQVLKKFPGVVTESEIHSLENLRGIPNGISSMLHSRAIRAEWDNFYKPYIDSRTKPTKEELLQKATEIDRKYGHQFKPRLGDGS